METNANPLEKNHLTCTSQLISTEKDPRTINPQSRSTNHDTQKQDPLSKKAGKETRQPVSTHPWRLHLWELAEKHIK